MELGLKDKVAIVTGGSRGIGAAIVRGFANEGANVVVADVEISNLRELTHDVDIKNVRVLPVKTDVTRKLDAENLAAVTMKEFGRIDVLVNNAGILRRSGFLQLEEQQWDKVLDVNTKGVYLVTQAVVPHMMAAKYGKIVNASSIAGKRAASELCSYNASKFAVIGITQTLAIDLAAYNINVNAYCPGYVLTPMFDVILDDMSRKQDRSKEQVWENWVDLVPLKRPQTPEDIANVVLFLSSDVSRNITGEAININGGTLMD